MKKIIVTSFIAFILHLSTQASSEKDFVTDKVKQELSLPAHLFPNEAAKVIRVSFIVNTEGRAEVTAVNAASKFLCESVKKEIESMKFIPSDEMQERNMIIRVVLK